jgi:tRNA 2-thiouridine synthesizing protein E
MFIFEGNEIETDSEGYLKDTTQWNEAMAAVIAEQEGISLSVEHWEVVRFVRDFYLEFNTSPAIRMLVKAMANKFGEEKGNSRYLYRLFPKGPAKQATKIAGLPKPVNASNTKWRISATLWWADGARSEPCQLARCAARRLSARR